MPILFDARWYGDHGVGRFAREIRKRLDAEVTEFTGPIRPWHPLDCFYSGVRLATHRRQLFVSPGYNSPLANVPFAFTIHDLAHIENDENRHPLKSAYYELIMKPACRRARKVFTVSEYSRARIAEWSGLDERQVINVSNGVDDTFCAGGDAQSSEVPYVFCPTSRRPHKNEERSMRAFARAYAGAERKLVFLGEPSGELLALASELGIAPRVEFLGRVDDEQLARVYRGARVVLFASLYEGFGLPVIEAMACGAPVITSNVCSLPEVAGGAALLVEPSQVDSITEALRALDGDEPRREQMRALGLLNARRFSWDTTGAKVREALAEVC
ncbi:MAG TPA: glycosyltransferase family 1 protein [Polyangiales bacterium]